MKKSSVKYISLILILSCFFILSGFSCIFNSTPKIKFMVDGEIYHTIQTNGNETITLPQQPTKQDYIFLGWYFDDGIWQNQLTENTYQNTELSKNVCVYAYFVQDVIQSVSLDLTEISLDIDQTQLITATVYPQNASNSQITWSSANEAIATVNNGVVMGISYGSTTITATTSNGKTASCVVTVEESTITFSVLEISHTEKSLYVGESFKLVAKWINNHGVDVTAEHAPVIFYSEEESIATVTSDGIVTAITPGQTNIIAVQGENNPPIPLARWFTATCLVTVQEKPFTINYILSGGTNSDLNPTTFTAEQEIVLQQPTKQYCNFKGWYTEFPFVNKVEKIEKNTKNDLVLIASWEIKEEYFILKVMGTSCNFVKNGELINCYSHYLVYTKDISNLQVGDRVVYSLSETYFVTSTVTSINLDKDEITITLDNDPNAVTQTISLSRVKGIAVELLYFEEILVLDKNLYITNDGLVYSISRNFVTIEKIYSYEQIVEIPESINNIPVKRVGTINEPIFNKNSNVKKIILPNNILSINLCLFNDIEIEFNNKSFNTSENNNYAELKQQWQFVEFGVYKYSQSLENLCGALNWVYQNGKPNFPNGKWESDDSDYFASPYFEEIFISSSNSTTTEKLIANNLFVGETIYANIRHLGFVSADCYLRFKISSTEDILAFNLNDNWFEKDGYFYYSTNNNPKIFLTTEVLQLSFIVNTQLVIENPSEYNIQLTIETLQSANISMQDAKEFWGIV